MRLEFFFSPLDSRVPILCARAAAALRVCLPQVLSSHRHTLAIDADGQYRAGALILAGQRLPRVVKSVEVLGRSHDQLFELALGDMAAGVFADALKCFVKGALGGFFGHAAAQFKRIALIWQVELGIQRMQTLHPLLAVSRSLYRDGSEHCLKLSLLKSHTRPYDPIITLHGWVALAGTAVIKVLLQQLTHQFPPLLFKLALKFAVRYGVCLNVASALIERNLFDFNRHSIAGGKSGCGYEARHNVELGTSLSHCFDMHGGHGRKDGTDIAGTKILIHHNTFRAPKTPVVIRGVLQDICKVYGNWFQRHISPKEADLASEKTEVYDNAYGILPVRVIK